MSLLIAFGLLLVAAVLLAIEVATGRTRPGTEAGTWGAVSVFAGAASAGGTLLVALPWSEWILILALMPLTAICVVRLLALLRDRVPGWRGLALATGVLLMGLVAGTSVVPMPLTRSEIQSALPGGAGPSAHPDAGRLVRT